MHIRAITPIHVGAEELVRRQARYDRLAPAGITVHVDDLPDDEGVPHALDDAAAMRASEHAVGRLAVHTDPDRFDLVLPDCVLDPSVGAIEAPVPLVGILGLVSHHLAALGVRFGSVTRNGPIGDELVRKLGEYGTDARHTGTSVLDLSFDAIADDRAWAAALTGARRTAADLGAAVVINGCSAVDLDDPDDGLPPALDPTALALRLLAVGPAVRPVRAVRDAEVAR